MPWTIQDVDKHNEGLSDQKKRQWVTVANKALAACLKDDGEQDACEASAIKQANGAVSKSEEAAGAIVRVPVLSVPVDGEDVPVSDLIEAYRGQQIGEAVWTTTFVNDLPDSSFALVLPGGEKDGEGKTKPRTLRKLPYKDANGKVDLAHLRNALSRLPQMKGVTSAQRASALKELQSAAKKHLKTHQEEMAFGETAVDALIRQMLIGFLLEQMGEENEEVAEVELTEVALAESAGLDADGNAPAGSSVIGRVIAFQERADDGQLAYIDLIPVSPGWGNKRDNHYYDLPVLQKYAHVWEGAKMWATDHKKAEKNALNQISEVVKSPVSYTDDGVPIARAVVLSPAFEEMLRRRKAADRLHTLHCSILTDGTVLKKPYKKDNRTGQYVNSFVQENAQIDWVTRGGAGGHALNLAETADGGNDMSDKEKQEQEEQEEAPVGESQEAVLSEAGQEKQEAPKPTRLDGEAVETLLKASTLPEAAQKRLAEAEYQDEAGVKAAITAEVAYLKTITGSGKPFGQGGGQPPEEQRISEADVQKRFAATDERHGLYVAEEVE